MSKSLIQELTWVAIVQSEATMDSSNNLNSRRQAKHVPQWPERGQKDCMSTILDLAFQTDEHQGGDLNPISEGTRRPRPLWGPGLCSFKRGHFSGRLSTGCACSVVLGTPQFSLDVACDLLFGRTLRFGILKAVTQLAEEERSARCFLGMRDDTVSSNAFPHACHLSGRLSGVLGSERRPLAHPFGARCAQLVVGPAQVG